MADHLKLYLFGDQTFDIQPHLKDLLRNRANPVLEAFLEKAYDAIRRDIYRLPHDVRDEIPRFTSLDDLFMWNKSGKRCIPLDMAVTCMYQLGAFIRYAPQLSHDLPLTKLIRHEVKQTASVMVQTAPGSLVSVQEPLPLLLSAAAGAH